MIANTAFLAALILFVAAMVTLEQLAFLAPYKRVILSDHLPVIAAFVRVGTCDRLESSVNATEHR